MKKKSFCLSIFTLFAILLQLMTAAAAVPDTENEVLRITSIDVGKGDCFLVETGSGTVMIDTGYGYVAEGGGVDQAGCHHQRDRGLTGKPTVDCLRAGPVICWSGRYITVRQATFGSCIRSLRRQQGMTQAGLADRLGVTDKAVSKWERDRSFPDTALLPKLADVLGTTVNDLLRDYLSEVPPSRLLQILDMSHDIRTPLHIMLGSADLAELHLEEPEHLRRYLDSIRIAGGYLLRAIDHLMQMTEAEQPVRDDKMPAVDLRELEDALEQQSLDWKATLARHDFSGRRFLVAEDIRINREIVDAILKEAGGSAEFAENGRICVEMMEKAPAAYYDMILMDIMMPEMDGLEAARRIRGMSDPAKAQIPIIAVSANVSEKERQAAADAGMNAFIEKPVLVERLFEMMNQYLGG